MILKLICCILFFVFKLTAVILKVLSVIATTVGGLVITVSVLLIIVSLIIKDIGWYSSIFLLITAFILPIIAELVPIPFIGASNLMSNIVKKRF